MPTLQQRKDQLDRIAKHGENLLAIFPMATERDPVKLCKKLRRLEAKAHDIALRVCNGPEFPGGYDQVDRMCDGILNVVDRLLGNQNSDNPPRAPIMLNRDARGYALKIRSSWMEKHPDVVIERDWGGYGILAPEIK